jgi:hypothetical protein
MAHHVPFAVTELGADVDTSHAANRRPTIRENLSLTGAAIEVSNPAGIP